MTTIISTRGLEKRFGSTVALDGLDFTVDSGEIHGFLGPNGAGKSTTIRILLGLARASGGEATLFGRNPWTEAADLHRRVAYVPGDVALWSLYAVHGSGPNLSGIDRRVYLNGYVAADACDRGEWAFRDGQPCALGAPQLVHYEELHSRGEPHYVELG